MQPSGKARLDWVDVAKGICIVLVVLMHSTHGVEYAIGKTTSIDAFIEWARPFRLPDFFLISGLFLAARVDRPWRSFLDGKVLHFAYFYVLWTHILLALKAPGIIKGSGIDTFVELYLSTAVRPYSTVWFLYMLAVYCVLTKLLRPFPKLAVLAVLAAAHTFLPKTGIFLIDETANRFVFFFAGYALASLIFAYADRIARWPLLPVSAGLALWAAGNDAAVASGLAAIPGLDLVVSAIGIAAVIAGSVWLVKAGFSGPVAYIGRNTIVIYVAFTVFMSATRIGLLKFAPFLSGETISLAATAAGVIGPLVVAVLVRGTWLAFLFERPNLFRLDPPSPEPRMQRRMTRIVQPTGSLPQSRLAVAGMSEVR